MKIRITDALFASIVQRAFEMDLMSERDAGKLVGLIVKGELEQARKHARAAMKHAIDLWLLADLDLIAGHIPDRCPGCGLREPKPRCENCGREQAAAPGGAS